MKQFLKRIGIMSGLATLLLGGTAHANQFMDVTIKNDKGPFAVCVGSMESDRVLGGIVTETNQASVVLPQHGLYLPQGDAAIIVTGASGTLKVQPEPDTSRLTVDMRRAEKQDTTCHPEQAVDVNESNASFYRGLRLQTEMMKGDEEGRGDPEILMDMLAGMEAESLEVYKELGIDRIVHGEIFAAIAEQQRKREERDRASELVRQIMAAIVARAEEVKRQREVDRRRKREEAEREWRRKEAEAAAEAEARRAEEEAKGEECFGAVGQGCAPLRFRDWKVEGSTCSPNGRNTVSCMVNTGSWAHDECCAANPDGVMCGGNESSPLCQAEWDHAWDHTAGQVFSWRRTVNRTVLDYDGRVDHDKYCAPNGATLAPSEGRTFCCSRNVQKVHAWFFGWHYVSDVCRKR